MPLSAETLNGIWCFIPTPWNADFSLAVETFRTNIETLCQSPIHGVYTPDTAGEFYELEEPEYRQLVDIAIKTAHAHETPIQIGCHWTNATGAIRRAEYAAQRGADAIRFSFPYWQKLEREDCWRFLGDLVEATDGIPLVHYNHPRSELFDADDYLKIVDRFQSVIGTKLFVDTPIETADILNRVPELSHFVGEPLLNQGIAAGADGMYSWTAITNPAATVEWYDACVSGHWDDAMTYQTAVNRWWTRREREWSVHTSAAYNKLDAAVNPELDCPLHVRPPSPSGTPEEVEWARQWLAENEPFLAPVID
jgi:4-hydroxy-tetrahydrodipicolinate synthase